MKRVLSHTIALVYGTGLSLCMASNPEAPFAEDRAPEKPVKAVSIASSSIPLINPYPAIEIDFSAEPSLRQSSESSTIGESIDRQTRWHQSILIVQTVQNSQIDQMRLVQKQHQQAQQGLERDKDNLLKELAETEKKLESYNQHFNASSAENGKGAIVERITELQARLESLKQEEPSALEKPLQVIGGITEVLEKGPEALAKSLTTIKAGIQKVETDQLNVQKEAIHQATKAYQKLLELKLTTPYNLDQLGEPFHSKTLLEPNEVRVSLLELGIPRTMIPNNTIAKYILGAALPNLLLPTLAYSDDAPKTNYDLLSMLQQGVKEAEAITQKNKKENIEGMAAYLEVRNLRKITVELPKPRVNDLYSQITTLAGKQPDDNVNLHLKDYMESKLFQGYPDVSEQWMGKMGLTNQVHFWLLTDGIMNSESMSQQISGGSSPAAKEVLSLLALKREVDPIASNAKLLESLSRDMFYNFQLSLLDHIKAKLEHLPPESD